MNLIEAVLNLIFAFFLLEEQLGIITLPGGQRSLFSILYFSGTSIYHSQYRYEIIFLRYKRAAMLSAGLFIYAVV